ncbi:MAG: hypothetical protein COB23_03020 [Methylophaga sp.]|nr:MAG: hypothetical protein COB23_03020 [Methylophaga sp.]
MKDFTGKHELTIYVYARQYEWDNETELSVDLMDLSLSEDFELLTTVDIEVDIPEVDLRGKRVKSLKKKRTEILAENQHKLDVIDGKIQSLLAIENEKEEL